MNNQELMKAITKRLDVTKSDIARATGATRQDIYSFEKTNHTNDIESDLIRIILFNDKENSIIGIIDRLSKNDYGNIGLSTLKHLLTGEHSELIKKDLQKNIINLLLNNNAQGFKPELLRYLLKWKYS